MTPLLVFLAIAPHANEARFVDELDLRRPNGFYVNQRAPLASSPLQKLPSGDVTATGWLGLQLDLQRKGFAGQLSKISRFLNIENNAWMGNGTAERAGWEELPYWLKGQVSLAYVTKDPVLIAECEAWIQGILKSQRADGWFGPESNLKTRYGTPDFWPNMLAQNVLQTYYEATGDKRVIDLMLKYVDYLNAVPKEALMDRRHYWHYQRVGDQLASLVWLYNRTGEEKILKAFERVHLAGNDWVSGVANLHGVNFAQGFREPATFSLLSKKPSDLKAAERNLNSFRNEYGQMPGGMYGADENARKGRTDPRQAAESCAIAEMMYSHELLLEFTGDPKWADHAEDVTFNWMPVTMTPDLRALRYLQAGNMAVSDAPNKNPGIENGGPMFLMDPNDHRCCQHNIGMGWPYFAERLWFATNDNGLLAALLAPGRVTARVGDGTKVEIENKTSYPFEDTLRFHVTPERKVKFPLSFRIPEWADRATLKVNGKTVLQGKAKSFGIVDREWKKGDVVELQLPMSIRTQNWSQRPNTLSIYRGPLAYSLRIQEEYRKLDRPNDWDAFEIHPKSAWNYGLPKDPKFEVKVRPVKAGEQPWTVDNVPVYLETFGHRIPEWQLDMYGLASPLQPAPAHVETPSEKITLIPMGAARLRMTVFPTVTHVGGHKWVKPQMPRESRPATFSHKFTGDTEKALSDGLVPKSSSDLDIPRFTWWNHKGTEEWVAYKFEANRTFQSCRVYWFDDTGNGECRIPQSWRVQVKIEDRWVDVEPIEPYTTLKDKWSTVKFKPVAGTEIRIVAKLRDNFSGGILEWEVN